MQPHRFRRSEIAAVIQRGRKVHAHYSWLKWASNDKGILRLAFAISRRHVRFNVKRNLIKRHHRESVRAYGKWRQGCDVVVFAKPCITSQSSAQIRADALSLWKKLKSLSTEFASD